jgi:hypothetical protein
MKAAAVAVSLLVLAVSGVCLFYAGAAIFALALNVARLLS